MSPVKITVSAIIAANKPKVWDYYTKPEHITKWNFASDDWHCPSASNNMEVGGKYVARMAAKNGSAAFDFEAIYNAIISEESFTYTMPDGRVVDVFFKDDENGTEVTVTFDAENIHSPEMQKAGWQAILNNYKQYTETN